MKVTLNKRTDNPFYGMRATLELFQSATKNNITLKAIKEAYAEIKNDRVKKELFFVLLFSIGDITAREHNIFRRNKVDNGGNANRESFMSIMKWMKETDYEQFKKFMFAGLFNEYTSFDNLIASRVRTKKKSQSVEQVIDMLSSEEYINDVANYIVQVIQGNNEFNKSLIAKFLTRPRLSKRKGHKKMLPQTKHTMKLREYLLKTVSEKAGFSYTVGEKYTNFTGLYAWRKKYNTQMESVMFSSKSVLTLDEQQFLAWLNMLPASARFRVRARLLTKDNQLKPKWGENLGKWFLQWEGFKTEKQSEQRVIEEKVRQGTASMDEKVKLEKVKKEAKVTTGAVNFQELFLQMLKHTIDTVKVQPFLDKIKLDYNTLVFVDDSGSMQSSYHTTHQGFTPFDFACVMATICLAKNPDDVGRSIVGLFSRQTRMFTSIDAVKRSPNSLIVGEAKKVSLPLYNPELHFLDNLAHFMAFANANRTGNNTDIASIPEYIHQWTAGEQDKIEQLAQFPVWTIITDGNWNNLYSPEHSLNDFFMKCEKYLGFKPFIVAIDVLPSANVNITRFEGIENFMYLPANPALIEQFLTNFKDMDVMDVYTPLLNLYRSNRYDPVKVNVL